MKTALYGQRPMPVARYTPTITGYANARERLETTPPSKLRPTHRLMGVSPAHTIREGENGDVIVRIAQTGHVVWHKNDTVTVTGPHRHQWAYNTLPEGVHRLEVVRPGYRTLERDVDVTAGEVEEIDVDLPRS